MLISICVEYYVKKIINCSKPNIKSKVIIEMLITLIQPK
jgi:hypothetical protein